MRGELFNVSVSTELLVTFKIIYVSLFLGLKKKSKEVFSKVVSKLELFTLDLNFRSIAKS